MSCNKKKLLLLCFIAALVCFFLSFKISSAAGWLSISDPIQNTIGASKFSTIGGAISFIINLLLIIGGVIFFIIFAIGGIMYLAGSGNDEATGKAKKLLIDAVIGLVILYSSWALANFVVYLVSGKQMDVINFLLPEINGGTDGSAGTSSGSGDNNGSESSSGNTGGTTPGTKTPEECYASYQGYDSYSYGCTSVRDSGYFDYWNERNCQSPDVWNPNTKTCVQGYGSTSSGSSSSSSSGSGSSSGNFWDSSGGPYNDALSCFQAGGAWNSTTNTCTIL